ncbi:MAG: tyrosine--tRNA ligase, partial [Euzebyales bacterium]|nr:tyrosine--tRNA ligase [Euzebyales bacterium]
MRPAAEQLRVLLDGVEQVLPTEEFERKVTAAARGERPPLRAKLGVDPTTPDLHLGHSVILRKLAAFQRLGHTAVLIVGGFTAQVGDPSGRSAMRPVLTPEHAQANAATYVAQVRKVLAADHLEVVDNADWLGAMGTAEVLRLATRVTVAQMLERADFAARYREGRPIAVSELLYPLLQGWDSVAVRSDVELGGTDQTFNLLVGRDLQAAEGQDPQCVLTMPLIEGTDGSAKMSKTARNAIGLDEPPAEMFGKLMSLPDALTVKYLRLVTDVDPAEVEAIAAGLAAGSLHPGETKRRLAREIVTLYHSAEAAAAAEQRFNTQFRDRAVPQDVPVFDLGPAEAWFLPSLLVAAGLCASGSEARRMVEQGAVRLDEEPLTDPRAELARDALAGHVLRVGKRRFARLRAGPAGGGTGQG